MLFRSNDTATTEIYTSVNTLSLHDALPFSVEVVDSAGAGDSFRGGLIYGMLRGWSDEDTVRFASAVGSLICTTAPGCVNPPTLEQVRAFLVERGAPLPAGL